MKLPHYGFLLLTSRLGDPGRKPLTTAQLRVLADRVRMFASGSPDRDIAAEDLTVMGYDAPEAAHIVSLLNSQETLEAYIRAGERCGCRCITRSDPRYPVIVRKRLGLDSPGCFWVKGDSSILEQPAISLVGNRNLREANRRFAAEAGTQAARQGLVLISGNAKGADNAAQEACLSAGGRVICVVADALRDQPETENVLYISENSYEEPFFSQRALSRNRVIHAMGVLAFVAQCSEEKGGTWDGTVKNLRSHWSPVLGFRDGTNTMTQLEMRGARLIEQQELSDFPALAQSELNLFDRQ